MLKTNLLWVSLVLGLAACSGGAAGQPAPVEVKAAPPMEVKSDHLAAEPMAEAEKAAVATEEAMAKVEESAVAPEEAMAEVEEPAAEPMVETEKAAVVATEEAMAKAEEPAVEAMDKTEEATTKLNETKALAEGEMMEQPTMAEAGPTEAQARLLADLKDQGMPPELFNQVWLNSGPLKLADLHGKVVIVEFWTFDCYNCKNVVPSLRAWHHSYGDEGLVIIGVHTPEFGYECELENVKQALIDQDIPYAVALDNDWQTWRAYHNRYWPAKYFVDKTGNLRHVAIGEGRYEEQEEIIKALLAEKG